jgi:hypothetical protein
MLAALRRHPIPIAAHFRWSLVLTFALPEEILRPLLPAGLALDAYGGCGFLAIALVQTEGLRPAALPAWIGRDFFLSGYRVFCRLRLPDGKVLRGLRILRSDTDSALMVRAGNLLTHYRYRLCAVTTRRADDALEVEVRTPGGEADLKVRAALDAEPAAPPPGSPFPDLETARRYAGPLPYTFDEEQGSRRLVVIQGVRENWRPRPVSARVERCAFLEKPPFSAAPARLANAFLVEDIPYRWERGVLASAAPEAA